MYSIVHTQFIQQIDYITEKKKRTRQIEEGEQRNKNDRM